MSKTYILKESVKDWIKMHKTSFYDDILESCEKGLLCQENEITVARIKSIHGVTVFKLSSIKDILFSLSKCEMYYANCEEYQYAARARDCGDMWKNRQKHIK